MEDDDINQIHIFKYTYVIESVGLNMVVDNQMRSVSIGDVSVGLSPTQFRILNILMWRAKRMVPRDDLLVYLQKTDMESGASVLSNAISGLRKKLALDCLNGHRIPIETSGSNYYFDGEVTAIAQVADIPEDRGTLDVAQHIGTIRGELTERAYVNAGIEGWHFQPSDPQRSEGFARIATTQRGLQRLAREHAIFGIVQLRAPDADVSFIPDSNFELTFHQAIIWPEGRPSLREALLKDGLTKLTFDERLALVTLLCGKVEKLNAAGIIHGDLKPSCILVAGTEDYSNIHLAGFAHAYVENDGWEGDSYLDLAFQRCDWHARQKESENYRAPELVENQPINHKTDVYALGVILYQIFAGDIDRRFDTNWRDDIECSIIREIISKATLRDPRDRLGSAGHILNYLRSYDALAIERAKADEHSRQLEELRAKQEMARQRKPYIIALFSLLFVSLVVLGSLLLQLRATSAEIQKEAAAVAAARDLMLTVMARADPRQSSNEESQSIDDMLARVSEGIALQFADSPEAQIDSYITIASVYRGRGDVIGERDNVLKAIAIQREQAAVDKVYLASNLYAYSALVRQVGEYAGQASELHFGRADEFISEADTLFQAIERPPPTLVAAQLYAKANAATLRGDFKETYTSLLPWLALVQEENVSIDLRGFNAVITFAEAASAIGQPHEGVQALKWLQDYPHKNVPPWVDLNRLTVQVKIMMALEDPETEAVILSTLEKANIVYGGAGIPEANLHHIYGNFLFTEARFGEAFEHQSLAQNIYCESLGGSSSCVFLDLFIALIHIRLDQFDEALPKLLSLRQIFEEKFKPGVAQTDFALAMTYVGLSEDALAQEVLERVDLASLEESDPGRGWMMQHDALVVLSEDSFSREAFDNVLQRMEEAGLGEDLRIWFSKRGAKRT